MTRGIALILVVAMVVAGCGGANSGGSSADPADAASCDELADGQIAAAQEFVDVFGVGPIEDFWIPDEAEIPAEMLAAMELYQDRFTSSGDRAMELGCSGLDSDVCDNEIKLDPRGPAGEAFVYHNWPCGLEGTTLGTEGAVEAEARLNDFQDSELDADADVVAPSMTPEDLASLIPNAATAAELLGVPVGEMESGPDAGPFFEHTDLASMVAAQVGMYRGESGIAGNAIVSLVLYNTRGEAEAALDVIVADIEQDTIRDEFDPVRDTYSRGFVVDAETDSSFTSGIVQQGTVVFVIVAMHEGDMDLVDGVRALAEHIRITIEEAAGEV